MDKYQLYSFLKSPIKKLLESGGCIIEHQLYMNKMFKQDFKEFVKNHNKYVGPKKALILLGSQEEIFTAIEEIDYFIAQN